MKVAVTGGTGCLGKPLVEKLTKEGFHLKILVRSNDCSINSIDQKIVTITGDLNSPDDLNSLCMDSEIVFHLAGKVHSVPGTQYEKDEFFRLNVEATSNLLKSAKRNKVKRVVFFSTVGVYGRDMGFHGDELSPCQPRTTYAKSKYQAEKLVLDSATNGGPEGVILRLPVVYGPFDRGNVASLIKAVSGKYFFYFGDGKNVRSIISSKNAAEAAFRAAFEPNAVNNIFCVTDGQDYMFHELIESICKALNSDWRPFHFPLSFAKKLGKLGDFFEKNIDVSIPITSSRVSKLSGSLTFSCEKAKKILNYKPIANIGDSIAEEVEWLKSQSNAK